MERFHAEPVAIEAGKSIRVSGLLAMPTSCRMALVLAPGAGAGVAHASMNVIAEGLYQRSVATLRFQFPYMERAGRRPDPAHRCHETVRAAVGLASELLPGLPLFAGGRSFGGRMTSQTQALEPLPSVRGLAFLAFPLHMARNPAVERAAHLDAIRIPMLFLQGTRDELSDLGMLRPVIARLTPLATLRVLEHADHAFHVPARSGRADDQVREEMLDAFVAWAGPLSR